jgi:hypothetical protein
MAGQDTQYVALVSETAFYSHAAMRCGIELLADKILGESDGQVVIRTAAEPGRTRRTGPAVMAGVAMPGSRAGCPAAIGAARPAAGNGPATATW